MHYLELIKLQQENISSVSVTGNFVAPVAEEITSADQVRMRLVSQLIKRILRVLQKSSKCFNSTATLTSFVLPSEGFFSCYFHVEFEWFRIYYNSMSIISVILP